MRDLVLVSFQVPIRDEVVKDAADRVVGLSVWTGFSHSVMLSTRRRR